MCPTRAHEPTPRLTFRTVITKASVFLAVAAIFGWLYGLASPRMFPRDTRAGFGIGMLHGALMPMALPSLVMGQDVEIYAPINSGRTYKLGYIVGINVCGLIFFGSVFWRPRKRPGTEPGFRSTSSGKFQ